jgi:hypothetical protein
MLKEFITPQDVCNTLNEMLALDYECVFNLISNRQQCNEAVANHPTIQVLYCLNDEFPKVGLIGVLNGMFGANESGIGAIHYQTDAEGKILEFKLTSSL